MATTNVLRMMFCKIPKNVAVGAFRNSALGKRPVSHSSRGIESIGVGGALTHLGPSQSPLAVSHSSCAGPIFTACYSTESKGGNSNVDLSFNDLQALLKSGDIQLIDVREAKEVAEFGEYPGAVNIPLGRVLEALSMSDDDFHTTFGTPKPEDSKVVFACLKGIRSRTAIELAKHVGYTKTRHYKGGWEEYHKQMGLPLKKKSSSG